MTLRKPIASQTIGKAASRTPWLRRGADAMTIKLATSKVIEATMAPIDPPRPNTARSALIGLPDQINTIVPMITSAITPQVNAVVRWLRDFRSAEIMRAPSMSGEAGCGEGRVPRA